MTTVPWTRPAAAELIEMVRGRLIVSVQAYPGEPMRDPRTMTQIAQACVIGGAVAIRAQGTADLAHMRAALEVPLIGLWKDGDAPVFITPTLEHALAVHDAGADVVALDGTRRERPDGRTLAETVAELRAARPDTVVMADCGSLDDGLVAQDAGADLVGTTLAGHSGERPATDGPDLELVAALADALDVPVVTEGRVHTPAHAAAALAAGAHTVVVGTAITHPATITGWFAGALPSR